MEEEANLKRERKAFAASLRIEPQPSKSKLDCGSMVAPYNVEEETKETIEEEKAFAVKKKTALQTKMEDIPSMLEKPLSIKGDEKEDIPSMLETTTTDVADVEPQSLEQDEVSDYIHEEAEAKSWKLFLNKLNKRIAIEDEQLVRERVSVQETLLNPPESTVVTTTDNNEDGDVPTAESRSTPEPLPSPADPDSGEMVTPSNKEEETNQVKKTTKSCPNITVTNSTESFSEMLKVIAAVVTKRLAVKESGLTLPSIGSGASETISIVLATRAESTALQLMILILILVQLEPG
jgi:hypothetical protein